jgi:LysM repeat protein
MGTKTHHYGLPKKLVVIVALVTIALLLPERIVLAQIETDTVIHIVSWGETVSSIAARYGVTIEAIVARNHLAEVDRIYAGQQLIIPDVSGRTSSDSGAQSTHVVLLGENLYRISLMYGVGVQELMRANGLADEDCVYAGQRLIVPQSGTNAANGPTSALDGSMAVYHIVQSGETLSGISQSYGVSMVALQTANSLLNPSQIFIGQRLIVPGATNLVNLGYTPQQADIIHVVQPGENLFGIATRYGVSVWVITQSNNISNPSLVYSGQRLSIPLTSALSPMEGTVGSRDESVVVDISEQRAYVYEDEVVIQTFVVSTGVPGRETMRGKFQIQNKIPMAYAATWDLQMPYWLGFYWAGPLQNGFHALPILSNGVRLWEGLLGRPASYGCVILSEEAAQWLYEWADIGLPVIVQD